MRWPTRSWLWGLVIVAMVALLPSGADAQAVATTFAGLQTLIKTEEYVVVIDRADRETWGKVAALSASELTLVMVVSTDGGARILTTTDTRDFSEGNVALILRSDSTGRKGSGIYPASWDTVDMLPSATDVVVTSEAGDRRRYRLGQATPDSLRLLAPSGQEEILRKSDILRVERQGVDDPSGNGAVIGALIGAGTGLGLVASMYAACDAGCDAPEPGGMYSMAAGFGAGIGALSGWVIDKLHKGRETVYPVVSPVLTSRHKGVVLSVKF